MVFKKIRLLIDENRYFANLITMELHSGKHAIKFTFKPKVSLMKAWERSFVSLRYFLFPDPQTEKKILKGETFDITYHVEGRKVEIKEEIAGGEIARRFLEVPNPVTSHLFTIHFRALDILEEVQVETDDLVLTPKEFGKQVAIIFSLVNEEGKGFRDSNFDNRCIEKGVIFDLDLSPLPALKVAVVTDTHDMKNAHFLFISPLKETKRS